MLQAWVNHLIDFDVSSDSTVDCSMQHSIRRMMFPDEMIVKRRTLLSESLDKGTLMRMLLKAILFLVSPHNPSRTYDRWGKANQRRQHNAKAEEKGGTKESGSQSVAQVSVIYFWRCCSGRETS